jgi:hypothetical protein
MKGKCVLKGHQDHQKIVKEVGKSNYYQPATSGKGNIISGYTDSFMSVISAHKLEESARSE